MNALNDWVAEKIAAPGTNASELRDKLDAHRLKMLRETLRFAGKSRYYGEMLHGFCENSASVDEVLRSLPFTTPADLVRESTSFLAASPSEAARVVTLNSSGTTGAAKRIFFSAAEMEDTADFFDFGMREIARGCSKVMIFMRGAGLPGGVCDLLTRGLARFGVRGIAYGEVRDAQRARAALLESGAECAVGIASQMLEIAALGGVQPQLKSLLLSADAIPTETVAMLEKSWGCNVFSHYGMTETCFGGAVDCARHDGMHMREPDMIFEIIDPVTGEVLPDGERGEIVLTTLTRRVMPLIRYRTGDVSRIVPGECACGCILRRLDHVTGRAKAYPERVIPRDLS